MIRTNKFSSFINDLKNLPQETRSVIYTFKQIEDLIGQKLCKSAYTYCVYWSYKGSPTHTLAVQIAETGFVNITVNLKEQKLYLSK